MSPYICNPDSRSNTLKSTICKETNGYISQKDEYELVVFLIVILK